MIRTRRVPDPSEEPTITVPRAAAVAGVALRTGYDQVERGDWPSVRIGRCVRIPTARWLRAVGLAEEPGESASQADSKPVTCGDDGPSHANVTAQGAT